MRVRAAVAVVVKGLTTTIIFFLLAECVLRGAYGVRNRFVTYVPLPYAVGDDYGPIPPWLDRLLILQPDAALIWKSAPNAHRKYVDIFTPVRRPADRTALLRRFNPVLPVEFRSNPVWEIALNAHGDRSPDIAEAKPPSVLRIACVGDSWTFGMNVNQDQTYPSRLAALLRDERPSARIEVMNFGVLGYSSFQGLQLVKARVLSFNPDIVAIGFGMNDSEVAGYRDKDVPAVAPPSMPQRIREGMKNLSEQIEFYKLLKFAALVLRYRPQSMADALKAEAAFKGAGEVNYDEIEPWVRVSPKDYEHNIREMIALARSRRARSVLLDNELWDGSPYRPILRTISQDEGVPLVDSLAIVRDARKKMEADLESDLRLHPSLVASSFSTDEGSVKAVGRTTATRDTPIDHTSGADVEVVFRVRSGSFPVPKTMSIVGADARLGALVPNTIAMRDDGSNGDERAGDGVWSYAARFPVGTRLFYMYTNSGTPGQWEGLDVPAIRRLAVVAARDGRLYPPIETFGKIYMQADNWHTDAAGYDLIARSVFRAVSTQRR